MNQAEAVTEHIEAAIGMKTSIGDEAACIFAAQFYSSIGFGLSLEKSFNQAKAGLMLEGIKEEDTPELFVHDRLSPDEIIIVNPRDEDKRKSVAIDTYQDDKVDIDILKAIYEECDRSRYGAGTGSLLKYSGNNQESLLKRLDILERKKGFIEIKNPFTSNSADTYGVLTGALGITLTDSGEQYLDPHVDGGVLIDEIDVDILKAIREKCDGARQGAFTGPLLKHCDNNQESLLKRLDILERKKGFIEIDNPITGNSTDNYGVLIGAAGITLTGSGEQFLDSQK